MLSPQFTKLAKAGPKLTMNAAATTEHEGRRESVCHVVVCSSALDLWKLDRWMDMHGAMEGIYTCVHIFGFGLILDHHIFCVRSIENIEATFIRNNSFCVKQPD